MCIRDSSKPVRPEELLAKVRRWVESEQESEPAADTVSGTEAEARTALHAFAASLAEQGFDREDVVPIFSSFLETGTELIAGIRSAVRENDPIRLSSAAHSLKGTFSTFGLTSLTNLVTALEAAGKSRQLNGVEDTCRLAESSWLEAKESVSEIIYGPGK